jgi:hypothetical protein
LLGVKVRVSSFEIQVSTEKATETTKILRHEEQFPLKPKEGLNGAPGLRLKRNGTPKENPTLATEARMGHKG